MDWVPRSVRARARDIERAIDGARGKAAPRADRRGDRREARDHDRRARRLAHRHLALVDRGARRALDDVVRLRRPGLADRHDRGHVRAAAGAGARPDRAPRGARRGDRPPARAREARDHALLLRGADPPRDRRGARRDRVARLAAPHEGDPAPEGAPAGTAAAAPASKTDSVSGPSPSGLDRTIAGERPSTYTTRSLARMPAQEPGKIRNVAVVGHRGTGKTSLVEALLFQSGAVNRLGTVEAGSTVSDWDDDEQRRQMSLSASLLNLEWQDRKINLIDAPGDAGFQGDTIAALTRRRGRARRRQRRDGRRGRHRAHLAPRRGRARRPRRRREHARPRARRLLPRPRGAPLAARRPLRRGAHPDRRRARADRDRRRPAHVRVHEPGGPEGGRARRDPRGAGRPGGRVPREAARRRRRDRRGADGALPRRPGALRGGGGDGAEEGGHARRGLPGRRRGRDEEPRHDCAPRPARRGRPRPGRSATRRSRSRARASPRSSSRRSPTRSPAGSTSSASSRGRSRPTRR